jgi:hypothetical protein
VGSLVTFVFVLRLFDLEVVLRHIAEVFRVIVRDRGVRVCILERLVVGVVNVAVLVMRRDVVLPVGMPVAAVVDVRAVRRPMFGDDLLDFVVPGDFVRAARFSAAGAGTLKMFRLLSVAFVVPFNGLTVPAQFAIA